MFCFLFDYFICVLRIPVNIFPFSLIAACQARPILADPHKSFQKLWVGSASWGGGGWELGMPAWDFCQMPGMPVITQNCSHAY